MNEKLGFTEKFFSFANNKPETVDSVQEDEVLASRITTLYHSVSQDPIYYTGPRNDLASLTQDENYVVLQQQLGIVRERIISFYTKNGFEGLGFLFNDFFKKILEPESNRITIFYSIGGKLKLEEISIFLDDKTIDKNQLLKMSQELLVSGGLTQCIDNCYLLIKHMNEQFKLIKSHKESFHALLRNFATDKAKEVSASTPFRLSQSFQEIFCVFKDLPCASYALHAKNYFLMYAKESQLPINVPDDVIAKYQGSSFHSDTIKFEYLAQLEEKFTASTVINFLAEIYKNELAKLFSDNKKKFLDKIEYAEYKLRNLGHDINFNWHEIAELNNTPEQTENNILLKDKKFLKITVAKRLIEQKFLTPPLKEEIRGLVFYDYFLFPGRIDLNWIEISEEVRTARYNFLDKIITEPTNYHEQQLKISLLEHLKNIPELNCTRSNLI